ncbi:MAG: gamma carbonic anhydrase family protein [Chromatiales bacterium]|nr:gamma carbonic anhydrase family protein [Chromatiales bacterium]
MPADIRPFEAHSPQVDPAAWVDDNCTIIGQVTVGAYSSLWPGTIVRGDVHAIRIGSHTNIQDGCLVHVTHDSEFHPGGFDCRIGDYVTVGHRVVLHACHVGDECLIGMGAIVMDGAVIERRVLLGAGSVVPAGKTLEGGYLWVGTPARRIRPLTDAEIRHIHYSANHYVKLAARHAGRHA